MTTQNIVMGAATANLVLADAASDTQNFENFTAGDITNGENGWRVLAPADQEVMIDGSGNHAFRMSSDPSSGGFGGPYSPDLGVSAGESTTTAAGDTHLIGFDVKAFSPTADNSRLEVDFGTKAGDDRNNFMVIENFAGGLRIAVAQPDITGDFGVGGTAPNDWTTLIDGLDPTVQHHIDMKLTYVDGANNDVIEIFVDGQSVGFTSTFENYRDALGGTHDANAEVNQTNRIFFRSSANGATQDGPGGDNQGFLFDNITNVITQAANVTGNALDNSITGNSADNVIDAGAGSDFVDGGAGDDTAILQGTLSEYSVQRGGADTLIFTHTADSVIDIVRNVEHFNFGGTDINVIDGTAGADVLGTAGVDLMFGGAGNDLYLVNDVSDKPVEAVNEGIDQVNSSVTYTLGANVENLYLTGSAVTGIGNNLNNLVVGNGAANNLYGGDGNDDLRGGAGVDHLSGGNGADTLNGGTGLDLLTGGDGNDRFVFNSANVAANRDHIADFSHDADAIFLESAIYAQLGGGAMHGVNGAFFHLGAAPADANDYLNYNQATGVLTYDTNGNGAGGSTVIATLDNHAALQANDIFVI